MQIKATQLRKGMIILYNNELHVVTDYQHITPGKGVACMQSKLKNIISGKNAENRFMSDETIEKVSLEGREMEYLYSDGEDFIFMDLENYEQIPLKEGILGDKILFLTPNVKVSVQFYENKPLSIEFSGSIDVEVTETAPHMKSATVTSSYKPATVETGATVMVPSFIVAGEKIRVNPNTGEYMERAK